MPPKSSAIVPALQIADDSESSKAQKQFNKLIKKIAGQRHQLADWQSGLSAYQQKYSSELLPLLSSYDEQRSQLVSLFDDVYDEKILSKYDRQKLAYIICSLARQIMANTSAPELETILQKYEDQVDVSGKYDSSFEEAKGRNDDLIDTTNFDNEEELQHFLEAQEQQWQQAAQDRELHAQARKKTAKKNRR